MLTELHGTALLLIQLALLLTVAKICGRLFQKMKQPRVIGEILGGLLLSLGLTRLNLGDFSSIFDTRHLSAISAIAQIGLLVFIFKEGCSFQLSHFKDKKSDAIKVALPSLIIPFLTGVGLAVFLQHRYGIFQQQSSVTQSALFIGVIFSVTAFPVLIKILGEQQVLSSSLRQTVITSAAVIDLAVWVALSGVTMFGPGAGHIVGLRLAGAVLAFAALYLAFKHLEAPLNRASADSYAFVILIGLILMAGLTEMLHLHLAIGAFCFGLLVPRGPRLEHLNHQLDVFGRLLLYPVFFTLSGVQVDLSGLESGSLLNITLVIVGLAFLSKMGGTFLGTTRLPLQHRERLQVSVLMNTRGLVEIVVLKMGMDMNIIPASLYLPLIIMALVTTFSTLPILTLIEKLTYDKAGEYGELKVDTPSLS